MPRVQWPLHQGRPQIEVIIRLAGTRQAVVRRLVADTGAGTIFDPFQLILEEDDCLQCGGIPISQVRLSGAFKGEFPIYLVDASIPKLGFDEAIPVVGIRRPPRGFDGIACFRFLARFKYGNHGDQSRFCLETVR